MRKVVLTLAFGATGFLLLCVAMFAYAAWKLVGLDAEARAYAHSAVQVITAHWDSRELRSRATQDLMSKVSDQKLSAMFVWFSSLGKPVHDRGCQGNASVYKSMVGHPGSTTGHYDCSVTFQGGDATIDLFLVKQDGKWLINGFHVNSDALMPKPATQRI
jgi:hypothetical protein